MNASSPAISRPSARRWPRPHHARWAGALLAALLALASIGCVGGPECGELPLAPADRRCIVETIDEMVQRHYPFAELHDVDLAAFSERLRDVGEGRDFSDVEFLRAVERQVATLKDGHTSLDWGDPARQAFPPFRIEFIDQRAIVSRVLEAADGRLSRGQQLVAVDGQPVGEAFAQSLARVEASADQTRRRLAGFYMLAGPANSTLTVRPTDGPPLEFKRRVSTTAPDTRPLTRRFGAIGYMTVPTFRHIDDIDRFDRLLGRLMDTEALILDVRGNGGGTSTASDAYLGRFFDHKLPAFEMVSVDGEVQHRIRPKPRGRRYTREVFVLTNELTYSAANYFVQRLERQGRATLVGRPTGGGAASPTEQRLLVPGVSFRVSTLVVTPPDAAPAETGIAPDVTLPMTVDRLRSTPAPVQGDPERDLALRRALELARHPDAEPEGAP